MPRRIRQRKRRRISRRPVRRKRPKASPSAADKMMKLHTYLKADGSFDLEAYRQVQIAGNHRKLRNQWASEDQISMLAQHITYRIGAPRSGLCHGTRRGAEQVWFRKHLPDCEVIGTEISDTAEQFPHTIQWDFHDVKNEWVGAMDFIYSNSFDHTYDPEKCLDAWMSCIRPGGLCILEHSDDHEMSSVCALDPFGATLWCMPYLIATWGKSCYAVREILTASSRSRRNHPVTRFLLIHKF